MSITPEELAEESKKKGNDAFSEKKYDEAISFYTEALKHSPENAVLYSNRCACYSSKKQWELAEADGIACISKDPNFIKGYFRVATAKAELGKYDEANKIVQEALVKEPENEQLLKLLKIVRAKRIAANKEKNNSAVANKPGNVQLDESQRKEFLELQEQTNNYSRDLRQVQGKLVSCQRDVRSNQVTKQHVANYDSDVRLYRGVGKAYVLSSKENVEKKLADEYEMLEKTGRDLMDRKEFLERRIQSNRNNMTDIMNASS